jgi:hypothetical protein
MTHTLVCFSPWAAVMRLLHVLINIGGMQPLQQWHGHRRSATTARDHAAAAQAL